MSLSEIQRQSYLETMGIQSYFPRYNLPAAKESYQCEWPEALEFVETETSESPQTLSTPVPDLAPTSEVSKDSPLKELFIQDDQNKALKNLTQKVDKAALEPEPVVDEVASTSLGDEVRFQLAFIRVNESLTILNQIPHVRRGGNQVSPAHRSLLLNLLKSVQIKSEGILFDDLPFCWPLSESEHIDKSEMAARATLNSYLEQKQSDAEFKTLIVMGEVAANYLSVEDNTWQVLRTHSLDEMLTMPIIKRDVWKQMLSLKGA